MEFGFDVYTIPQECIEDCTHQGSCDDDVTFWRDKLNFLPSRQECIRYMRETGAWTREELEEKTDCQLAEATLWLLCCDFKETGEWMI